MAQELDDQEPVVQIPCDGEKAKAIQDVKSMVEVLEQTEIQNLEEIPHQDDQ